MKKIWLEKSYPPEVPFEIDADKYTSIHQMLELQRIKHADKIAFISMDAEITYQELWEQAEAFSAYLQQELGFCKGDKFALMLPNTLQYPIALFGALMAGLVVVNINPLYTPRELKYQLNDSHTKGILILENFAHTLSEIIHETGVKSVIITSLGDRLGRVKGPIVNAVVKYIKKKVPKFLLPNSFRFNDVLKQGQSLHFDAVKVQGNDLAFLQYTGGTTGLSKGAMLTHRNMIANFEQAKALISPLMNEGEEIVVTALPLYHIFALTANFFTFLALGSTNVLITNPRDMNAFVKDLGKYRFTALTGVNTLFNGLLHHPKFKYVDFSALKLSIGGGMAVQKSVAESWRKVTSNALLEGYGLTECAPLVSLSPYNQKSYSGDIGLPAPSTDIRLYKDDGSIAGVGEPGEMWVKGPQVMQGYYDAPDETNSALKNGWFATGDIAEMDVNGFFKIVDRKKDMILVSGFSVFPNEIEDVLMMQGELLEVAAIGVPHESSGEAVKVFAVRKNSNLTEDEVLAYARKNLTCYKIPKHIEFRDELPKSNVGKILRRALRDN